MKDKEIPATHDGNKLDEVEMLSYIDIHNDLGFTTGNQLYMLSRRALFALDLIRMQANTEDHLSVKNMVDYAFSIADCTFAEIEARGWYATGDREAVNYHQTSQRRKSRRGAD